MVVLELCIISSICLMIDPFAPMMTRNSVVLSAIPKIFAAAIKELSVRAIVPAAFILAPDVADSVLR